MIAVSPGDSGNLISLFHCAVFSQLIDKLCQIRRGRIADWTEDDLLFGPRVYFTTRVHRLEEFMKNEDSRFAPENRMKSALEQVYPLFQDALVKPGPQSDTETVTVRLCEILPALSFAFEKGLLWVEDFENDRVQIPRDLNDVIHAIQEIQNRKSS